MTWTQFWDMHSGGGQKLDWPRIYIEADQEEAERIFYNRFGRNPHKVTCTCCGPDYSVSSDESLAQLTGYHRGCEYDKKGYIESGKSEGYNAYRTLAEYMESKDAHFITADQIKPEERGGSVPRQGYVWAGD